jgi:hypothetical protein
VNGCQQWALSRETVEEDMVRGVFLFFLILFFFLICREGSKKKKTIKKKNGA